MLEDIGLSRSSVNLDARVPEACGPLHPSPSRRKCVSVRHLFAIYVQVGSDSDGYRIRLSYRLLDLSLG